MLIIPSPLCCPCTPAPPAVRLASHHVDLNNNGTVDYVSSLQSREVGEHSAVVLLHEYASPPRTSLQLLHAATQLLSDNLQSFWSRSSRVPRPYLIAVCGGDLRGWEVLIGSKLSHDAVRHRSNSMSTTFLCHASYHVQCCYGNYAFQR